MERLPTPAEQGLNPLRDDVRGKKGGMLKFRIYQRIMNILLSMQISFILYLLKIFVCLIHPSSSLTLVCHSIRPRSRYVCLEIIVVFLVAGMKTGKDIGPRLINFANKLKAH